MPGKIRIRREEGYHTDKIGRCKTEEQFMAFIVAFPGDGKRPAEYGRRKWYTVLHLFDSDGKHLSTKTAFLGTWANLGAELAKAESKLDELIGTLGPVTYGDVEIKLFSVRIDGNLFGLVNASVPKDKYQRIDLVPNELAFFPPWDGTYST